MSITETLSTSALMPVVIDDGGRAAAGFKGLAGDCVTRSIAIAARMPYTEIYGVLSAGVKVQRKTKRSRPRSSARDGVTTRREWFRAFMEGLGWEWVPTMGIGTGCRVHLVASELPPGRLIVAVSGHYTAVIDGVIHDTHDPQRGGKRCVYGYWRQRKLAAAA